MFSASASCSPTCVVIGMAVRLTCRLKIIGGAVSWEAFVDEPFSYEPSVNDDPVAGQQLVYKILAKGEKRGFRCASGLASPLPAPELVRIRF